MDPEYWQSRWKTGQIGFHRAEVNDALARHEPELPRGSRVFVPLAGKSVDMAFLASRGHEVVGVELALTAVRAFFAEQGIESHDDEVHGLLRVSGGGVSLFVADLFSVGPEQTSVFDAIYDRAALIAISPATRERYVAHLLSLLGPSGCILLVSFEYDQKLMAGPPFSLSPAEVNELFRGHAVTQLLERDILAESPRQLALGATWVREAAFLIAGDPR